MTTDARTCNIEGCPTPGHTPGEWAKGHYLKTPTIFWERGNGTVAIATVHDIASVGDPEANAALIARAPDLAHALVGLVKAVKGSEWCGWDQYHDHSVCHWCGGASEPCRTCPSTRQGHSTNCEGQAALAAAETALGASDA